MPQEPLCSDLAGALNAATAADNPRHPADLVCATALAEAARTVPYEHIMRTCCCRAVLSRSVCCDLLPF